MKKNFVLLLLFILPTSLFASKFSDITTQDPNYNDFKYAIKHGYFSIYDEGNIKPDSFITRREASIIISKFQTQLKSNRLVLSSSEIKELNDLAKSFKTIYTTNENTIANINAENIALKTTNDLLKKDLMLMNNSMNQMKKDRKLIFILLGVSTLVGALL